ncbi:IQ domain-containing protein F3-like isoform X5 [Peromyscus eremicus]|uniref:IQ domain-containing protein F3-like isoform X5 n=1 Tax=Peromyscus eremicus TaxID=42410 RepID=UPI0027DDA2FE|nr:IQ domain-containing protein F3-like isoform X5 [Peromyscus eremicus]
MSWSSPHFPPALPLLKLKEQYQEGNEHLNPRPPPWKSKPKIRKLKLRRQMKPYFRKGIQRKWSSHPSQRSLTLNSVYIRKRGNQSACVIQCWWRNILHRHILKQRLALLRIYVIEEEAAVRLQAWVRRWQCRRYFSQTCNTLCVVQSLESSIAFRNDDIFQVQYGIVSKQPEFHIEILSL